MLQNYPKHVREYWASKRLQFLLWPPLPGTCGCRTGPPVQMATWLLTKVGLSMVHAWGYNARIRAGKKGEFGIGLSLEARHSYAVCLGLSWFEWIGSPTIETHSGYMWILLDISILLCVAMSCLDSVSPFTNSPIWLWRKPFDPKNGWRRLL